MRDDDLKDFFDADAYDELLNAYAEEAERKRSVLADVHRKTDAPQKGDVPVKPRAKKESAQSTPASARQPRTSVPAPAPQPRRTAAANPPSPTRAPAPQPRTSSSAPQAPRQSRAQYYTPNTTQPSQQRYARAQDEPIRPMSPAEPSAAKFKVEIQGLDEEFSQPSESPRRASRVGGRARPKDSTRDGAFANFAEIVKKRRAPKNPADENFAQTDMRSDKPHAEILKKQGEAVGFEAVKAFFLKNKATWIVLLACLAAAIILSTYTISCMNDIFAVNRDSETVVTVNIPAEANTKTVLKILQENDLIEHRHFCAVLAKMMHFKDDNYLTGVYYVTASMGVEKMLSTFKVASITGETVTLTFPEGYTAEQIVQKLEKYEVCTAAVLYQTMREVDFSSEFPFIAAMDDKEARFRLLEGYLYPDTYEFYIGESPSSVLRKFLNNFHKKWTEEYAAQAEKLGMSVDDVITLASIIQKEAYGADQSPLVSSVLHNRLNKSGLYPSLQCDSTEEYINEYIKPNLKDAAQLNVYVNRYSSYKCVGLPVGAICNPGDDAIKAALFFEKTDYYFFAHDVNKKLYLARNDSERRSNNLAILNANSAAEKKKSN